MLPTIEHHCTAASVNRKPAAVSTFCEFHARSGVAVASLLTSSARPAASVGGLGVPGGIRTHTEWLLKPSTLPLVYGDGRARLDRKFGHAWLIHR